MLVAAVAGCTSPAYYAQAIGGQLEILHASRPLAEAGADPAVPPELRKRPALAGAGDQEVVPAVGAAGTGETVGEDAALAVATEFPLGDCGRARPGAILLKRQPGGKMRLHRAI